MAENIIYYTFSTIPQVLGGAIGLLGVFCLYKIQDFNTQLKGSATAYLLELEREPNHKQTINNKDRFVISRLTKAIEKSYLPEIEKELTKLVSCLETPSFKAHLNLFKKKLSKRNKLISQTISCTFFSIITIIFSFFPLPFSADFTECQAKTLALIGILFLSVCISWVGIILYKSLKIDDTELIDE